MSKSRVLTAAGLVGVLIATGFAAGPAFADDPPPLVWTVTGVPTTVDGVTVTWETASSTTSAFGGTEMLDAMPVFRPEIENNSTVPKYFGFGTDFVSQGTIDHLWTSAAWGAFDELIDDSGVLDNFWVELPAGAALSTGGSEGGADLWYSGMPSWSGHTITIFELNAPPTGGAVPAAAAISSVSTPGRFVGADLSSGEIDNLSAVLGQRATVTSDSSGAPELFRGLTASIEASGLTPGDVLELWIAKDFNYALFQIEGGGLPVGAVQVGTGTVDGDGKLVATFTLPSDLALGSYQLVAGDRAERYWPAGSYDDFSVDLPTTSQSIPTAAGPSVVPIVIGGTQVTLSYPAGTTAGLTTVTVSSTGPAVDGFQLLTDPRLYYHLDTTATLGGAVTVCISFDPDDLGSWPPQLFHFTPLSGWTDITTSRSIGQVCGATTSFSPFAVGFIEPETFDFSGFFNPVSMDQENIAKPGQAIPVKFSLNGDHGLDVITSAKFITEGTATSFVGETIDAVAAGGSGLSYSAASDQYTYVWKTNKAWSLKTGRFELTLSDGTVHTFNVTFKK